MRGVGSRAILAVSGGVGKKWGQRCQALHGHVPALIAETGILQKHVHVAGKEAYHAGLSAPEVVGQGAALFEVVAANRAESGNALRKALGQPGVCRVQ